MCFGQKMQDIESKKIRGDVRSSQVRLYPNFIQDLRRPRFDLLKVFIRSVRVSLLTGALLYSSNLQMIELYQCKRESGLSINSVELKQTIPVGLVAWVSFRALYFAVKIG